MSQTEMARAAACPRMEMSRRRALAGLAGAVVTLPLLGAAAARATQLAEAGAAALDAGPAGLLTRLGYFEATYRIVAALYLGGARALARAHLEESHHAFYEDIAPALTELGAPGFAAEAGDFLGAVNGGRDVEAVAAAYEALLGALAQNGAFARPSAYDRLISVHALLMLAAAEYAGGVDAGRVVMAIEYRDSWGFYATAQARAEAMAASGDLGLVKAGADVLAQLDGVEALYPGLTAKTTSGDVSRLSAAAGWAQIIALRV